MKETKSMKTLKESCGRTELEKARLEFWKGLIELAKQKDTPHQNINPSHRHWLPASAGVSGLAFTYVITREYAHVELYIGRQSREENVKIFEAHRKNLWVKTG
jgi:hypothetical protein